MSCLKSPKSSEFAKKNSGKTFLTMFFHHVLTTI